MLFSCLSASKRPRAPFLEHLHASIIAEMLLVPQSKLQLTVCLFTGQSSSFPTEGNVSTQASGISSAPRPNAIIKTESEAKDVVLGELLTNTVHFLCCIVMPLLLTPLFESNRVIDPC